MTKIATIIVVAFLLLFSGVATAGRDGRGPGQGGDRGGMTEGSGGTGGTEERMMQPERKERAGALHEHLGQVRTCQEAARTLNERAREMRQLASGKRFDPEKMRQLHSRFREEMQLMESEQEKLAAGMGEDVPRGIGSRLRNMDGVREQLRLRAQEMDQELAKEAPSPKQMESIAREMEKSSQQLQRQYGEVKDEMEGEGK